MSLLLARSFIAPNTRRSSYAIDMLMLSVKVSCRLRRCGCRQGSWAAVRLRANPWYVYAATGSRWYSTGPVNGARDETLRAGLSGGQETQR